MVALVLAVVPEGLALTMSVAEPSGLLPQLVKLLQIQRFMLTLPATWAEKGKAILPLSGICVRKPQFSKPPDEEDDLRLSNMNFFKVSDPIVTGKQIGRAHV